MAIKRLLNALQKLKAKTFQGETLYDKVFLAYRTKVLNDLEHILTGPEPQNLNAKLKSYLSENWKLINGTSLSYTALPNNDLTHLLCEVAEFVSTSIPESYAVQVLMPTVVSVESTHTDYPDLKTHTYELALMSGLRNENRGLTEEIDNNLVEPGKIYLCEKTKSYLVCDTKGDVKRGQLGDGIDLSNLNDILEVTSRAGHTLTLKQILRTYILGAGLETGEDRGKYLVPVQLLARLQATKPKQWFNPYYDAFKFNSPLTSASLHTEDYDRICRHSVQSMALKDAKEEYDDAHKKGNSALFHLQKLSSHLYFNSAAGVGKEEDAGKAVYTHLIEFQDFYNKLDKYTLVLVLKLPEKDEEVKDGNIYLTKTGEYAVRDHDRTVQRAQLGEKFDLRGVEADKLNYSEFKDPILEATSKVGHTQLNDDSKRKFPVCVKKELDKMLRLCFDPGININATENMDTCIATLRDRLRNAIQQNDPQGCDLLVMPKLPENLSNYKDSYILYKDNEENKKLVYINLGGELEEVTINDFNQFEENLANININITKQANGSLYLTPDQVKTLITSNGGHMPPMQSNEKILGKIGLSNAQAEKFINEKKKNWSTCQEEFEKAVHKGSYNGSDKLSLTLELINKLNINISISSLDDLRALVRLKPDEVESLLEDKGIRNQVVNQFKNIEELVLFINETPVATLRVFLSRCGQELGTALLTAGARDLSPLLPIFQAERLEIVVNAMKGFITSGMDFGHVFAPLSMDQRSIVFEAMKGRLPGMIKYAYEVCFALKYLSTEQRASVFERMTERLPEMIYDAYGFSSVLAYLSTEQRAWVFERMEKRLPDMICNACDFSKVLEHLSTEQRATVFKAMEKRLPALVKDTRPDGSIIDVDEEMKHGHEGYGDPKDFGILLWKLSPEQCTEVCGAMKDRLTKIMNSAHAFRDVLGVLSPEQRTAVYTAMKEELPKKCIKSAEGLGIVLQHLSPEECAEVCASVKREKPQRVTWMTDACEFHKVLEFLSSRQCAVLCAAVNYNRDLVLIAVAKYGLLPNMPSQALERDKDFFRRVAKASVLKKQVELFLLLTPLKVKLTQLDAEMNGERKNAVKGMIRGIEEAIVSYFESSGGYDLQKKMDEVVREAAPILEKQDKWLKCLIDTFVNFVLTAVHGFKKQPYFSFFSSPNPVKTEIANLSLPHSVSI